MIMTTTTAYTIDPYAAAKVQAAIDADRLRAGTWGDGVEAVCAMSAMVPGAHSVTDCVTAGWPGWLAILVVSLFDIAPEAERAGFALAVAQAVQVPVDYDAARTAFLIARLDTGEYSALKSLRSRPVDVDWWRGCEAAVVGVVDALRGNGDMDKAYAAARAAADAAAYAAARQDLIAAINGAAK